jgi:hypothetical protein
MAWHEIAFPIDPEVWTLRYVLAEDLWPQDVTQWRVFVKGIPGLSFDACSPQESLSVPRPVVSGRWWKKGKGVIIERVD